MQPYKFIVDFSNENNLDVLAKRYLFLASCEYRNDEQQHEVKKLQKDLESIKYWQQSDSYIYVPILERLGK